MSTFVNQKHSRSTENIFFESLCSFLTFYQLFKDSRPTIIRMSTTRDSQLTRLYFPFVVRDSPPPPPIPDRAHSAHHYDIVSTIPTEKCTENRPKNGTYEGTKFARWNAAKLDAKRINRLKKKIPKKSESGLTIIGRGNARSPRDKRTTETRKTEERR